MLLPAIAHADSLASGGTELKTAADPKPSNTTMDTAKELKSGKTVRGVFYSSEDSNTTDDELYDYWYRFKTSNRWSMYRLMLSSVDGRDLRCNFYDSKGERDYDTWNKGYYMVVDVSYEGTTDYAWASAAKKKTWYLFEVKPSSDSLRYDAFTLKVTEHPYIKRVSDLRTSKVSKKSATVKWGTQPNAKKYQVRWKTKWQGWKTKTVSKKNALTITKLKPNAKYKVQVRAYCKNGYSVEKNKISSWGSWSNAKSFKTKK